MSDQNDTVAASVTEGRPDRPLILLVGFTPEVAAALATALPDEDVQTLTVAAFCAGDATVVRGEPLGCLLRWVARDVGDGDALVTTLLAYRLSWLMAGTGLGLVDDGGDPPRAALQAELGIETTLPAGADLGPILALVGRWRRRAAKYGATTRRLMRDVDASLGAGDYETSRRLIDSLVLIDSRKRVYLALLGVRMKEAANPRKAEESWRRTLVHWPQHLGALASLCELAAEDGRFVEAAAIGRQLVDGYGLWVGKALAEDRADATTAAFDELPHTQRLLASLYGGVAVIRLAKAYLEGLARNQGQDDDAAIFTGIMRQTVDAANLTPNAPLAIVTRAAPETTPAQTLAPPTAAVPEAPLTPVAAIPALPLLAPDTPAAPLGPLSILPPTRSVSDSKLLEMLTAARAKDHEAAPKPSPGYDVVYKGRISVFHPEANGFKRIATVLGAIGCETVDGHHEAAAVIDRLRAGKTETLVLWYQDGMEQALTLLQELAESRDLYRMALWILVPSQATQAQLLVKAQHLLYDAADVVRWQRAQFADDFRRMLARAQAPGAPGQTLTALRRAWTEPRNPSLPANEVTRILAGIAAALAGDVNRSYWYHAETVMHALGRGEADALAAATKLVARFPAVFDARLVLATAAAQAGGPERAGDELVEWLLAKQLATPERGLRVARLLAAWGAGGSLGRLATTMLKGIGGGSVPQCQVVAALYYRLAQRERDALAHLTKALELAPLRLDYIADLATTYGPKESGRAADLWEHLSRLPSMSRWDCLLRGGEALALAGNNVRAQLFLEEAARSNPESADVRDLLARVSTQAARAAG